MRLFSQRIGKTPIKTIIQTESVDEELKNALWNALSIYYWDGQVKYDWVEQNSSEVQAFLKKIWIHFFKNRLDEMPLRFEPIRQYFKHFFFEAEWYEIYDFIEFIPSNDEIEKHNPVSDLFIEYCNHTLKRELSAYRFIDKTLTPISSKEELESIEIALSDNDNFKTVRTHLNRALQLFSDRSTPDYRNSIKESISAVESYCSILTGSPKSTLGQALKVIERDNKIHPALKQSFSNLYGYSSDSAGIRHALLEEDNLRQEDAKFMLVTCSAFINYLRQKEVKAESK